MKSNNLSLFTKKTFTIIMVLALVFTLVPMMPGFGVEEAQADTEYKMILNNTMRWGYSYNGIDIQGWEDNDYIQTTYGCGGYSVYTYIGKCAASIADYENDVKYVWSSSSNIPIEDANGDPSGLEMRAFVTESNGAAKLVYEVTNTSSGDITFSIGAYADVKIGNDDAASLQNNSDNSGFSMMAKTQPWHGKYPAFYFTASNEEGFDYWFGHSGEQYMKGANGEIVRNVGYGCNKERTFAGNTNNLLQLPVYYYSEPNGECVYIEDENYDAYMAFSWKDVTLEAGAKKEFAVSYIVAPEEIIETQATSLYLPDPYVEAVDGTLHKSSEVNFYNAQLHQKEVASIKEAAKDWTTQCRTKVAKKGIRTYCYLDGIATEELYSYIDKGYTVTYDWYRADGKGKKFKYVDSTDKYTYLDNSVKKGKYYEYKVKVNVWDEDGNIYKTALADCTKGFRTFK